MMGRKYPEEIRMGTLADGVAFEQRQAENSRAKRRGDDWTG